MNTPKISFCTTCMGRLEHLKLTLHKNLRSNLDYIQKGGSVEFVLLNYGADQDMENWVKDNYAKEILSGELIYASFPSAKYFHMSHAKNMAHRIATGEVLCNVDADNYIGEGFAQFIAKKLNRGRRSLRRSALYEYLINDSSDEGSAGRIVVLKEDFDDIRGYSEKYLGWGGEDNNFSFRLMKLTKRFHAHIPSRFLKTISHENELRFENLPPHMAVKSRSKKIANPSSPISIKKNWAHLKQFRHAEIRNESELYGVGEVYINFSDRPTYL